MEKFVHQAKDAARDDKSHKRVVNRLGLAVHLVHRAPTPQHRLHLLSQLIAAFFNLEKMRRTGLTRFVLPFDLIVRVTSDACDVLATTREADRKALKKLSRQLLALLHLSACVLYSSESSAKKKRLHASLYRLLHSGFRLPGGATLLHQFLLSCNLPGVAGVLVDCGADVNGVDCKGDTPLHLCSRHAQRRPACAALAKTAALLVQEGGHMDARNAAGELAGEGICKAFPTRFSMGRSLRLSCLAARAVMKNDVPYKGNVPVLLEDFVAKH
jgi:hypothetical protein